MSSRDEEDVNSSARSKMSAEITFDSQHSVKSTCTSDTEHLSEADSNVNHTQDSISTLNSQSSENESSLDFSFKYGQC